MAFADAVARDALFIHSRDESEFGVEVKFWGRDGDPAVDAADAVVRGTRFGRHFDRKDMDGGQSRVRRVMVSVVQADVVAEGLSAIDASGWVSVAGEVFSVENVSGDDGVTWFVEGSREVVHVEGDMFGG